MPGFHQSLYQFGFGGAFLLLILHLALYRQTKDDLLLYFCWYLFSLNVFVVFTIMARIPLLNNVLSFSLYRIFSEIIEVMMYYFYILYVTKALYIHRNNYSVIYNIVQISKIIILSYCTLIFILYLMNYDKLSFQLLFLVIRIVIFLVAIVMLFRSKDIRNNVLLHYIQIATSIYFILGLASLILVYLPNTSLHIYPLDLLLIAILIDLIIFSYAMAVRAKESIIRAQNELQAKALELQDIRHQQEILLRNQQITERQNIAMDLHDDIGASISSIRILGSSLLTKTSIDDSKPIIQKINNIATDLMENISDWIWLLHLDKKQEQNLNSRLKNYIFEITNESSAEYKIDCYFDFHKIKLYARRNIWLILKECINNINKHSKATKAEISFNTVNHNLYIRIKDNGIGIQNKISNGNGLNNIKERTDLLDGKIEILNNDGLELNIQFDITKISD